MSGCQPIDDCYTQFFHTGKLASKVCKEMKRVSSWSMAPLIVMYGCLGNKLDVAVAGVGRLMTAMT